MEASRQLMNSDSGSSTNSATKAAKCSRKNESHSPHSASTPVSITFISRPECVPPWKEMRQLQHVLEIVGQHRLLAAVREPVGMERDQHAAADGEQPERRPRRRAAASAPSVSGGAFAACVFTSASMMRPNRTGSANCAAASATLATASIQPSRASGRAGRARGHKV